MLSYILRIMQEFERAHGRHPQVIYLNARHMQQLMNECPDLFREDRPVPLGFRIVELSEEELPHPKAAWLPEESAAISRDSKQVSAPPPLRSAARKKSGSKRPR